RRLKPSLLSSPELLDADPFGAFVGRGLYDSTNNQFVIRVPLAEKDAPVMVPIQDYLLRHTLRRPREMIILANSILEAFRNRRNGSNIDCLIREAVDDAAARVIANGYIGEVRHRWPWGDPPDESMRQFIVQRVHKNMLTAGEVEEIESRFAKDLGLTNQKV